MNCVQAVTIQPEACCICGDGGSAIGAGDNAGEIRVEWWPKRKRKKKLLLLLNNDNNE